MFSSRFQVSPPTALARLVAQSCTIGSGVLDLCGTNPTVAGISYPVEILAGFGELRNLVYDPSSFGILEAREQVGLLYRTPADRVVLTTSTSEAYAWLFKLLCDPGDNILVPRPSYPLFEYLAALESVEVRHYPLRYFEGWSVDTSALRAQITPRTRAIVAVHPNNPTGSYLAGIEMAELNWLCSAHELALISDEVFANYALTADPGRAGSAAQAPDPYLAFTLNGLSKLVALPQMKLGWMVVTGTDALVDEALERLEVIADTYLSVGTPVQHALPGLLQARETVQKQIRERCSRNLRLLQEAAEGTPATVLRVDGGWLAPLRIPDIRPEEDWASTLIERYRVSVQPGYFYDFETGAHVVVSLLTPEAVFAEGIRRLLDGIEAVTNNC